MTAAQISTALNLSPSALPYTWRYVPRKSTKDEKGAQIDLLFDRDDDSITLCEIKYTNKPFNIDKNFIDNIRNKQAVFLKKTRSKKQMFIAIIASSGISNKLYADEYITGLENHGGHL